MATILFVAYGFIWIFQVNELSLEKKLAASGGWLILSFMVGVYSAGIGKGQDKMKIQVPLKPAVIIFSIAFTLFVIAATRTYLS